MALIVCDTLNLSWLGLMERETGIEPATSSLGSWRSTAELLPLTCCYRSLAEARDFACGLHARKTAQLGKLAFYR